tara:strand:- start:2448 stop:2681 length:234 start_codon:yes stop_codon:yes gene_type:complete
LTALAKDFDMTRNDALSWILVETAPPKISTRREKATRFESLSLDISEQASAELGRVVTASGSSASAVVEAYLGRKYI